MSLPAADVLRNAANEGIYKDAMEAFLAYVKAMPGGAASTELTIASGSITPTGALHTVDTEADAASDDLDVIAQDNLDAGAVIILSCADASRAVTVMNGSGGTGQILTYNSNDAVLNNTANSLLLKRVGTSWKEIGRLGPWALAFEPVDADILRADTSAELEAAFGQSINTITDAATPTIDFTASNIQEWTITAARTFPDVTPAMPGFWLFRFKGAFALALPTGISRRGSVVHDGSDVGDSWGLFYYDGTNREITFVDATEAS